MDIIKDCQSVNSIDHANGFAEWMLKIKSVHYANTPAMERAYAQLLERACAKN
jgi:hypothetical protein